MIKNQKGSISILALFFVVFLFALSAMVVDMGQVFCTKIMVKHKVNLSLRGACGIDQLDLTALRDAHDPKIVINEADAQQKFEEILKENLHLDNSFQPLSGSPCDGPVSINYFEVVNNADLPFSYTYDTYSETLTKPGAVGIVSFPYRNSFFAQMAGVPEITTMTIHVTTGPELVNKHLENW